MSRDTGRSRLALLAGLLLALALSGRTYGGGWSVVTLDEESQLAGSGGQGIVAGESFRIGFTVLQHGTRPLDGLSPRITATHAASGESATFTATAEGAAGHYSATITLPHAGEWRWQIDAYGPPAVLAPLTVIEAAPASGPAQIPAALPVVALLAALAAVGALLALRARRQPVPA